MMVYKYILALLLGSFTNAHDIHVSITDIEQDQNGYLEISIKTFRDDLQAAVGLPQSGELSQQYIGADELISQYVQNHFIISKEGHKFELEYEESIPSGDAVWIYLKSKKPIQQAPFVLRSTFMLELFNDQANIINVKGEKSQKALFDHKTREKRFQF
jgi:hypothetical protein